MQVKEILAVKGKVLYTIGTDKKLAEEPDSTCPNFSLITGEYTFCKSYSKDCDPEERK